MVCQNIKRGGILDNMSLEVRVNAREAAIKAQEEIPPIQPLNPPFPYRVEEFKPESFGVGDDPPENKSFKG